MLTLALLASASAGVHQEHARVALGADALAITPISESEPTAGPDVVVYGYLPYWVGGLDVVEWDELSHLAIFNVDLNSDGTVSGASTWTDLAEDAVAIGDEYGVRIHLTITCFDDDTMHSVLEDEARWRTTIDELASLVNAAGAHGVSVDFEGVDADLREELVVFVEELAKEVEDVSVATPAVDWSSAFDYAALAEHSMLFIMGYGYHWSGGDPGPVAPLIGGGEWSSYSLEWTVEDYLDKGAPADRIILGLPTYGREWPTTDTTVPGSATDDGEAVTMNNAWDHSGELFYEPQTECAYAFPTGTSQLWFDDPTSIAAKIGWTVDQGLAGTGFWALGYAHQTPEFWTKVRQQTTGAEGPAPLVEAQAGLDFMAYVGETIILNGSGTGGDDQTYMWELAAGPTTTLSGADTANPQFTPEVGGTYSFELVVRSGGEQSQPDAVDVIVVRTDAGEYAKGDSGCSSAGGSGWWLLGVFGLMARRRRAL